MDIDIYFLLRKGIKAENSHLQAGRGSAGRDPSTALPLALLAATSLRMTAVSMRVDRGEQDLRMQDA
jgi:hypothetical protein